MTIFHCPPRSNLHTELNVPMRLPEGSSTGPDVIASVPESSTSTCSGAHEKGACAPSKNAFQRVETSAGPRDAFPFDIKIVSAVRNEANAAGSRSANVLANATSVRRTCSFNSALLWAFASPAMHTTTAQEIDRIICELYRRGANSRSAWRFPLR